MFADIELLILPYCAADKRSVLHILIDELGNPDWSRFQAAVAFAKATGNFPDLLGAMRGFAQRGGGIELTFGADGFSGETRGSDYQAIDEVLAAIGDEPTVRVHLYHELGRTFHPKVYLFSNVEQGKAVLIVGSSNWSGGGLHDNIEANVLIRLDLATSEHRKVFDDIQFCFATYWTEP